MMQYNILSKEYAGDRVRFSVEYPAATFTEGLNMVYREQKAQYTVEGFRKGGAPRKAIEKKFGPTIFHNPAVNLIMRQTYAEIINDLRIEPVGQPSVCFGSGLREGFPFVLEFEVAFVPEIKLGQYKGIKLKKPDPTDIGAVGDSVPGLAEMFFGIGGKGAGAGEDAGASGDSTKAAPRELSAEEIDRLLKAQATEIIAANAEMDLSDEIFENEVDEMMAQFEQILQMKGATLDEYLSFTGSTREALKEDCMPTAQSRVKRRLALNAVIKAEKITATDAEIRQEAAEMAGDYGMSADDFISQLGPANLEVIKENVCIRKAEDFIIANAIIE